MIMEYEERKDSIMKKNVIRLTLCALSIVALLACTMLPAFAQQEEKLTFAPTFTPSLTPLVRALSRSSLSRDTMWN